MSSPDATLNKQMNCLNPKTRLISIEAIQKPSKDRFLQRSMQPEEVEAMSTGASTPLKRRSPSQAFANVQPATEQVASITPTGKYSSMQQQQPRQTSLSPIDYHQKSTNYKSYFYSHESIGASVEYRVPVKEKYCTQNKQANFTNQLQAIESGLLILERGQGRWSCNHETNESLNSRASAMNKYYSARYGPIEQESMLAKKKKYPNLERNLSQILFLVSLLCLKNASPCSSFGDAEYSHNTGFIGFDYVSIQEGKEKVEF